MKRNSILILVLGFVLSGCSMKYTVEKATQQDWIGGAAGSGGGTKYLVTLTKSAGKDAVVNKIWVGDREQGQKVQFQIVDAEAEMIRKSMPTEASTFRIQFSIQNKRRTSRDDAGGVANTENAPDDLPDDFTQGAVIYMTHGEGKQVALVVNDFERLEPLIYP